MSTQKEDVKGLLLLLAGFTSNQLRSASKQLTYMSRSETDDGSLSYGEKHLIWLLAKRLDSAASIIDNILTGEK